MIFFTNVDKSKADDFFKETKIKQQKKENYYA